MASLALLPDELLLAILIETARVRSVKRASRLRLVCNMIEEEGVEIKDNKSIDKSIFLSHDPVEFSTGTMLRFRPTTLLSMALQGGHEDTAQALLDAGAEANHAIEFAAMCGLRALVRLLWECSGNDTVQGAFVTAVDREDTGMFNLLRELGARVDDDVRVALLEKAQREGLEPMCRLLNHYACVPATKIPQWSISWTANRII